MLMSSLVPEPLSILVIDDEPDNFDVVEALFHNENYVLNYASDGLKALELLKKSQPDLILLDVMMPGMDGIELCQRLKDHPGWQMIPIIMVTALTTKEDLARCLAAGADDFISKPVDALELRARVRSMLRISTQHKNIQYLCDKLQQANEDLKKFNAVLEEQVRQRTLQLQNRILYDPLTELPSRVSLLQRLEQVIQQRNEISGDTPLFALLHLDCDQFKLINSSLGYDVGDRLLVAIRDRLSAELRSGDMLARLGEDDFCILVDPVQDLAEVHQLVAKFLQCLNQGFLIDNYEMFITACIGIVVGHARCQNPQDILRDADTAMYKAKTKGKGCFQIFDQVMQGASVQRLRLENDLRRALERHEFLVHYQPIVDLKTERITGFEALVRWRHPEQGMVSPIEFIPCVEETGLIVPLGTMVLQQACQQLQVWRQSGFSDLVISVNLSVRQFAHPLLIETIDQVLQEAGINPTQLKLEITESAIMDNPQAAIEQVQELRRRNIQLSIDDFGTGYSSLSYLHKFPVDSLKIDRSFISRMDESGRNLEIVRAIVTLGQTLNMSIIAEGIETAAQLQQLQSLGCEYGQGYFFSQPMNAEAATILLTNQFNSASGELAL